MPDSNHYRKLEDVFVAWQVDNYVPKARVINEITSKGIDFHKDVRLAASSKVSDVMAG